ncbi:hypothetical protein DB30_08116 [Enhygromyxa salina]|uniref:Uncharacterized protein n=1 Tax=Enhygromyxa salina TaxID=215803 RepID=A0A0C1Z6U5_9BACT|nr:hypothetical protein [Enhygromyxa salina]KIG13349.1 hypothetical protein DB30_08116 [Enhygromyxa salina]
MSRRIRIFAPLLASLVLLSSAGCQPQETPDIPNRVLDRPTDLALVCAVVECDDNDENCVAQPLPLSVCQQETGSCTSDNPHLVGFVANSERNEIAMFTKCSNRLVDLNVEIPGYNFIPAGILPTDLDASDDGCRVLSANVGSCDLTLLDAPALAGIALGNADPIDEPSSLVTTLIPTTFDAEAKKRRPLGARPGQVLSVPANLTQAPGLGPGQTLTGICDPLVRASAYVSFPTCNLVAEVNLQNGEIIQSRQFQSDGFGGVTVVDTGVTPTCPLECPAQFEGDLPSSPLVDATGPFVQALELSLEVPLPSEDPEPSAGEPTSSGYDEADAEVVGQRLFVGGLGSDLLFEIPIEDTGQWKPLTNQLMLSDAGGIKGIRVSPAVNASIDEQGSPFSQFIYVVAGDGSTRVVGRELPAAEDSIGIECETQLDPSIVPKAAAVACVAVAQSPNEGQPASRRGFARGPGLRPGRGEEVTDWMFRKAYVGSPNSGPSTEAGTVAVGVTSGGYAVYSMIDQERANGQTEASDLGGTDPASIMEVRLFAHSLWPQPTEDLRAQLPVVQDDPPGRVIANGSGITRQLAPTLRRIDAAYTADENALARLNVGGDFDRLGAGDEPLYADSAARVIVHDYRSWGSSGTQSWSLEWEGTIQNTQSSTGRISCANADASDPTCSPSDPGDARLIDSTAAFCDDGVLAGDKLVLIGCNDDDDCGDGRRCLLESDTAPQSSGICISASAYDDGVEQLRKACGTFISDPCGEALREYTITRAFQDQLWIEPMTQAPRSYLRARSPELDDGCPANSVSMANGDCACLAGFSEAACGVTNEFECCPDPSQLLSGQAPVAEFEDQFVCTNSQPDGGCTTDDECTDSLCIDSRCRRPCENASECRLRRLPGPGCFQEFVRYQVALSNAFQVTGPGVGFVQDLVEAVEADDLPGMFECQPTANADISRLLTSRLPLPPTDDPDDPEWLAIPTCADDQSVQPSNANPCRIVSPRAATRFHQFEYEGIPVSALRYSNPVFSIVLDLSALEALSQDVPSLPNATWEDAIWPAEAARFRRSRIPRGYRVEWRLSTGYGAFADRLILEARPVTYPVRIVPGPQSNVAYIVDGSGPGTTSSIRGQVVRVTLGDTIDADEAFIGVR